jgi:hypothetical protein
MGIVKGPSVDNFTVGKSTIPRLKLQFRMLFCTICTFFLHLFILHLSLALAASP